MFDLKWYLVVALLCAGSYGTAAPIDDAIVAATLEKTRINTAEPDATAKAQIKITKDYKARKAIQVLGTGGRVVAVFGQTAPELVCAPLKICTIELAADEKVIDAITLSDTARWFVELRETVSGGAEWHMLIIKPLDVNITANLTIPTSKRYYVIDLISVDDQYTPILSFDYPLVHKAQIEARIAEGKARKAAQKTAANKQVRAKVIRTGVATTKGFVAADALNFNYAIRGNADFAPVRVYDDGRKTYIDLPERYKYREKPVLLVNKGKVVNVRIRGLQYQIDGLFTQATLTLGGKKITLRRNR